MIRLPKQTHGFAVQHPSLAALLCSPEYAQGVQLYLEYDPAPLFDAGVPDKVPKRVRQFLEAMF